MLQRPMRSTTINWLIRRHGIEKSKRKRLDLPLRLGDIREEHMCINKHFYPHIANCNSLKKEIYVPHPILTSSKDNPFWMIRFFMYYNLNSQIIKRKSCMFKIIIHIMPRARFSFWSYFCNSVFAFPFKICLVVHFSKRPPDGAFIRERTKILS